MELAAERLVELLALKSRAICVKKVLSFVVSEAIVSVE